MGRKRRSSISDCGSHSLKSWTSEHAKKLNPHQRTVRTAMLTVMGW